jgi:hypothetical protein
VAPDEPPMTMMSRLGKAHLEIGWLMEPDGPEAVLQRRSAAERGSYFCC